MHSARRRALGLMWAAVLAGRVKVPRQVDTHDEMIALAIDATGRDGRRIVPLELLAAMSQEEQAPMDGRLMQIAEPPPLKLPRATHSRAVLSIGVGPKCEKELDISRVSFQRYAARVGAQYIELTRMPPLAHGCAYKYALSQVARHYEQTLLLDTDVIVMPDAEDIFAAVPPGSWGLVDDLVNLRQSGCTDWLVREFDAMADALGVPRLPLAKAWNSGVVVAPRDAWQEYYPPPGPVPATWCAEQHWHTYCLLEADQRRPGRVVDLDLVWQAGFPWDSFPSAVLTTHIVHINGCHGPHEVRLELMRHFAAGRRAITPALRSLFNGTFNPPWWILHGL